MHIIPLTCEASKLSLSDETAEITSTSSGGLIIVDILERLFPFIILDYHQQPPAPTYQIQHLPRKAGHDVGPHIAQYGPSAATEHPLQATSRAQTGDLQPGLHRQEQIQNQQEPHLHSRTHQDRRQEPSIISTAYLQGHLQRVPRLLQHHSPALPEQHPLHHPKHPRPEHSPDTESHLSSLVCRDHPYPVQDLQL